MAAIVKRRLPVFSPFVKTLLDDASATAFLTTLGVETGSYTPAMSFATPGTSSFSYGGGRSGRYFKCTNAIFVFWYMDVTPTIGTGSGAIRISMPFTAYSFGGAGSVSWTSANLGWSASRTQLTTAQSASVAYTQLYGAGSSLGPTALTAANMTDGAAHLLSGNQVIFTS